MPTNLYGHDAIDMLTGGARCSAMSRVDAEILLDLELRDVLEGATKALDLPGIEEARDEATELAAHLKRKYEALVEHVARMRLSVAAALDGRGVDVDADPAAALAVVKAAAEGMLAGLVPDAAIDLAAEEARLSRPAPISMARVTRARRRKT